MLELVGKNDKSEYVECLQIPVPVHQFSCCYQNENKNCKYKNNINSFYLFKNISRIVPIIASLQ